MAGRKGTKSAEEKAKQKGRTKLNKIRLISKELLRAGGKAVEILKDRLTFWKGK